MDKPTLKSIKLGKLRVNLAHLVWYTPTGVDGGEGNEEPSINLKTSDSDSPVSIRYTSIEKRNVDLDMLDRIFAVEIAEHDTNPQEAPVPNSNTQSSLESPSKVKLPSGLGFDGS